MLPFKMFCELVINSSQYVQQFMNSEAMKECPTVILPESSVSLIGLMYTYIVEYRLHVCHVNFIIIMVSFVNSQSLYSGGHSSMHLPLVSS